MDFKGPARPLANGDVSLIAGYLGCHVAAVRAVLAVEAAGKGFDSQKRPKMLFEPHVFWRELGAGPARQQAAAKGLAYKKQGEKPYPKDSYPRLIKAMAIDATKALRSASWGLGQVMGFNHSDAGFSTVQAMVESMKVSEGAQIYAMARFIVSNKLHVKLKALDWAGFALGYNGPGYAKHGYHTKLKAAYDKRPASEKVTPPPTTAAQLAKLMGAIETAPPPTPEPPPVILPPKPVQRPPDDPGPEIPPDTGTGSVPAVVGWAAILAALGAAAAFITKHLGIW